MIMMAIPSIFVLYFIGVWFWIRPKKIVRHGPCRWGTHEFREKEVINILLDPKCVRCKVPLSQVERLQNELNAGFAYSPKRKFTYIRGGRNA